MTAPRDEFAALMSGAYARSDSQPAAEPAPQSVVTRAPAPNRAQGTSDHGTPPSDPRTAFAEMFTDLAAEFTAKRAGGDQLGWQRSA